MIRNVFEISDLALCDLDWREGILTILKESDHLLRRFGQVDVVTIESEGEVRVYRQQADEFWTLLSGKVSLHLKDQRQDSPSQGAVVSLDLSQKAPQAVLIPFGVICTISSTLGATLLRICTHQDGTHPEDQAP